MKEPILFTPPVASVLLTREEIAALTGAKTASGQRRWLDKRNWIHETDAKGRPQIARAYFDAKMTGAPIPGQRRSGPRLDFMLGAA